VPEPFQPLIALRVLSDGGVRFVVIGGIAAVFRGWPGITQDLDVCYSRDPDNLERLATALRALGARLRGPNLPDDLPFVLDARTIALGDTFTFETEAGNLDVLATPSGTDGFADLERGAAWIAAAEGLKVRVCSLDDLIRMKRAAGRTKDLIQLEDLAALRERIERMQEDGRDPQQGTG
jgi:hypothetical protein